MKPPKLVVNDATIRRKHNSKVIYLKFYAVDVVDNFVS